MFNYNFKSPETFVKLTNQLEMLLSEQRHQRQDLSTIKRQLHTLINNVNLQTEVDKFFEEDEKNIPEA